MKDVGYASQDGCEVMQEKKKGLFCITRWLRSHAREGKEPVLHHWTSE
jgi:hypothetical protein